MHRTRIFSSKRKSNLGEDLQETVSYEYVLKILLADFYMDKNYYIDIFYFDNYLNKQLMVSSENQFLMLHVK